MVAHTYKHLGKRYGSKGFFFFLYSVIVVVSARDWRCKRGLIPGEVRGFGTGDGGCLISSLSLPLIPHSSPGGSFAICTSIPGQKGGDSSPYRK